MRWTWRRDKDGDAGADGGTGHVDSPRRWAADPARERTFLGKVMAMCAQSLQQSALDVSRNSQPLEPPDLKKLDKARVRFQFRVWFVLFAAPIATYLTYRYGGPLVDAIKEIPDPGPGAWDPQGTQSFVTTWFRRIFQHKTVWVLLWLLLIYLYWRRARNAYFREDQRAQDAIEEFETESQNQILALQRAKAEFVRLRALNSTLSPWAELIAWVIHEPQPDPDLLHANRSEVKEPAWGESAQDSPLPMPNAVRLGRIELTDRFSESEIRSFLSMQVRRGWLGSVFIDVLEESLEGLGLSGSEARRQFGLGDLAGTDVRPHVLRQLREGAIEEKLRARLEQRAREHRRTMVEARREGISMSEMTVVDLYGQYPLRDFISALSGSASPMAFKGDIWSTARQAEGGHHGTSGAEVSGELRPYLWCLEEYQPAAPSIGARVFPTEMQVSNESVLVMSVRVDLSQVEPMKGFAHVRQPVAPQTLHVTGEDLDVV